MKTNIVLFLILLALIGTLVGVEWAASRKADSGLAAEPLKFLLTHAQKDRLDSPDLTRIVIRPPHSSGKSPIEIARMMLVVGDKPHTFWGMPDLDGHPVKARQVRDLLTHIKRLKLGTQVAEFSTADVITAQETLDRYGLLEADAWRIEFYESAPAGTPAVSGRPATVPIVALMIGNTPANTRDGEVDPARFIRYGEGQKPKPGETVFSTEFDFTDEVRLLDSVPDQLLSAELSEWLDLALTTSAQQQFNASRIYRVNLTGRGMADPVALQRFDTQPASMDELNRLLSGPPRWYFAEPGTRLLGHVDDPAVVDANEVSYFINHLRTLEAAGFIETNSNRVIPSDPYLHVTLLQTGTFDHLFMYFEIRTQMAAWNIIEHLQNQLQTDTIAIGDFVGMLRDYLPLSDAQLVDFLNYYFELPNALEPIFTDLPTDGQPPIDAIVMPYRSEMRAVRGFRVLVKNFDLVHAEINQRLRQLAPGSSDLITRQQQELIGIQQRLRATPRNSANFERLVNDLMNAQVRFEALIYRTFGDTITLLIVREAPEGESAQAQTQPQTQGVPTGTFKVLSSTSQFQYWYRITPETVAMLRKSAADFTVKPDGPDDTDTDTDTSTDSAPSDAPNPRVRLETNHGAIVIELLEDDAPNTVANFITLAEDGFYDGTRLHRVIDGFMIQGGDPTTKAGVGPDAGTGGPGYRIVDEFSRRLRFTDAGLLAMANSGPNTNGSQFFITLGPAPHLNQKHTIFGRVVEGMDVVRQIGKLPVRPGVTGEPSIPVEDIIVEKITVLVKRGHDYTVNKLGE